MSIEDEVALLERIPTLRLLGSASLRMLAIGSETRFVAAGEHLFKANEAADGAYVVQTGAIRMVYNEGLTRDVTASPGILIGELALIMTMARPATATALEDSTVLRISRGLFQRILESDPDAAVRLRDAFASRTTQIASDMLVAVGKLGD